MGKPEGKRPLRRLRRRWVDNIRMDLQEVGCGYMDIQSIYPHGYIPVYPQDLKHEGLIEYRVVNHMGFQVRHHAPLN